ncbi:hypothetical protein CAVV_gp7 [Cavally virus]|uniref:Uncharacterized protein n=2 Tax=Alphamesonivirus cavallyense TaxID=1312874 RepID=F8RL35_AMV79|nr:hypothetical protein CAVV_gp7 [Cavally virus]AEH26450.1 hypothetical protein [Cavally virus]BBN23629.1 hypothetical protein [Cavally virus]
MLESMLDLVVGRKRSAHVYVSGLGPNRRFLYIRTQGLEQADHSCKITSL